jgi:hypothetical protein
MLNDSLFFGFGVLLNVDIVVIVQELNSRPCPVIFLAFSGAPKACMYKVLQVSLKGFNFQLLCGHFVLFFMFLFQWVSKSMLNNAGDHG